MTERQTSGTGRSLRGSTHFELPVTAPFRLDLTASALRRVPSNVVDVLTDAGEYLHAIADSNGPLLVRVTQPQPAMLAVTIEGAQVQHGDHARIAGLLRRTLAVDHDLEPFYRRARRIEWLAALAHRMKGVKPPRYRSLWEAFINSVTFQQVSLHAATAVVRRLVSTLGVPVAGATVPLYVFPEIEHVMAASDAELRELGYSATKTATLRRAAEAITNGTLSEAMIEERPSAEAAQLLCRIKGVGPWTANVILLRGFGRMDVFPGNDSGVARNFSLVAGGGARELDEVLLALGPQQGLLYFHLLLARLEAQHERP